MKDKQIICICICFAHLSPSRCMKSSISRKKDRFDFPRTYLNTDDLSIFGTMTISVTRAGLWRIVAWYQKTLTTPGGVHDFGGARGAQKKTHYRVDDKLLKTQFLPRNSRELGLSQIQCRNLKIVDFLSFDDFWDSKKSQTSKSYVYAYVLLACQLRDMGNRRNEKENIIFSFSDRFCNWPICSPPKRKLV